MSRTLPSAALAVVVLAHSTLTAQVTRAPIVDAAQRVPAERRATVSIDPHPALAGPTAAPILRNGAVPTGLFGYYDYQSNGMLRGRFIADPEDPQKLYVAYMRSASGSDEATVSANRRVGFAASTDGGATWSPLDEIDPGFRLGYPSLALLEDGTPLIACHGDPDGQGVRTMTYAGSGTEFFRTSEYTRTSLFGRSGEDGAGVIWPTWAIDPTNPQKTILVASLSNLDQTGSAPLHVATADVGASAQWRTIGDSMLTATSGGRNPMAVSAAGKVGVAYYKNGGVEDAGIYFSETTDGGATWSTPVKCLGFDYTDETYGPTDTISIGSNIDLVYLGEEPLVAATGSRAGLYAALNVFLWSPSGGARPIVGADSTKQLGLVNAAAIRTQPNMGYISYPTISVGDNGRHVVVAFQAAAQASADSAQVTSPEGFYYFRLWGVGSNNGGVTWGEPFILQDFAGDGTDSASLEYPTSLSSGRIVGDKFEHRMTFQGRRYPGMYAFVVEDISADPGDQPAERGPFSEAYLYFQQTLLDTADLRSIPASTPRGHDAITSPSVWPNPATGTVTVGMRLTGSSLLNISIVDPLGRTVASPIRDETRHAGYHSIPIVLPDVLSGAYRIVARTGSQTLSLPLTITK